MAQSHHHPIPRQPATLSERQYLSVHKPRGWITIKSVFGMQDADYVSFGPNTEVGFQVVLSSGNCFANHPAIVVDPPLAVGELVNVTIENHYIDIESLLPRVLLPPAELDGPAAAVSADLTRVDLAKPIGLAVAQVVFGLETWNKIPRGPDGAPYGAVEFALVVEPGQPADKHFPSPLSVGELVDVTLRAPPENAKPKIGKSGRLNKPKNVIWAVSRYPRILFPFGAEAAFELLGPSPAIECPSWCRDGAGAARYRD